MTQQKIKELLTKTFGEEEANDPDVVRLYTDCLRQAVEEVTNEQSLLDSFAKAAMQGIVASSSVMRGNGSWYTFTGVAQLAEEAYDIAEAMLQERERRMKG